MHQSSCWCASPPPPPRRGAFLARTHRRARQCHPACLLAGGSCWTRFSRPEGWSAGRSATRPGRAGCSDGRPALDTQRAASGHCRWTILQKDGPTYLGLWHNVLPEHQMALITSGCAPSRMSTSGTRPRGRSARASTSSSSRKRWQGRGELHGSALALAQLCAANPSASASAACLPSCYLWRLLCAPRLY